MIKKIPLILIVTVLITLLIILTPKQKRKEGLTIFMAASTTNLMEELAEIYKQETDVEILLNAASTGVLAKQITSGAQADIFISASWKWVDYLAEYTEREEFFVKNSLVLISPVNSKLDSFDIHTNLSEHFSGRLSMGNPEFVPAGAYGKDVLQFYNWYEQISPRLLLASNVREALSVVEMGETELGIVYKTDAMESKKVNVLFTFPEESHAPIKYYCIELKGENPYKADFFDFLLKSKKAEDLYIKYGFDLRGVK